MSLYFDFLYDQKRYNKSPGNHIISGNLPILNYEENNTIPINYCPMCGRKLREDSNMIKNCFYFGEEENEY